MVQSGQAANPSRVGHRPAERVKDAVNTVWWLCLDPHPKASNRGVLKEYSESQIKLMEQGYKPKKRPSEHDISDKFGQNNNGAIPPNLIIPDGNGSQPAGTPVMAADGPRYKVGANSDENAPTQPTLSEEWLHEGFNGLVPVNVIAASNTSSNDQYLRLCREHGIAPHPARFPKALPEFVIGLCTDEGNVVLDPFAGSNMTGHVAETMHRRWIAFEQDEEYLKGAALRFSGQIRTCADDLLSTGLENTLFGAAGQPSLFES